MDLHISKQKQLKGEVSIPGDKSISHRSIILGSLAKGRTRVQGFLESEDCLNTLRAFRQMGVEIRKVQPTEYLITGSGLYGLKEPDQVIDCGNSGTSMRLLTGVLAAQKFYSVLTGDDSLRNRPMDRVIEPLSRMGAQIWGRSGYYAPLSIRGTGLNGLTYTLPVASAQVKSAILLAGLYADGDIQISEPGYSRDHTERMLKGFGIELKKERTQILMPYEKERVLEAQDICVPGDISSAAFFIAAGLIVPGSEIYIKNVGINSTRSGILEVIKQMGGNLKILNQHLEGGEPVADILVKSSQLRGVTIAGEIIPTLIDELPIIALLASQAEGETVISDAGELRVKETDRIKAMVMELTKLGVEIIEKPDGMIIHGPATLTGGCMVDSHGDHRIAMTMGIAELLTREGLTMKDRQSINTSFPQFYELLRSLM